MRAILIDPTNRTVTEVDYSGKLEDLYELLDCKLVTNVSLGQGPKNTLEGMYADDNGLQKLTYVPAFTLAIAGHVHNDVTINTSIVGKALICAVDHMGKDVSTALSVEAIRDCTTFSGFGLAADRLAENLAKLRIGRAQAKNPQQIRHYAYQILLTRTALEMIRKRL